MWDKNLRPQCPRGDLMFFIAGVYPKSTQLEYNRAEICGSCGKYGRYEVLGHYNVLSLFFIPVFKWGWKYTVTKSCCGQICALDKDIGDRLRQGEDLIITEKDLTCSISQRGHTYQCQNCGTEVNQAHNYCPNCGQKL